MIRIILIPVLILLVLPLIVGSPSGSVASYRQTSDEKTDKSREALFTQSEKDLFAVDIKNSRLGDVLVKLSHDYRITFFLPSSLQDEEVMVRFSNLDLDKGIKKILAPYNTVFIYDEVHSQPDSSRHATLKEVRIYTSDLKGSREEPIVTIRESGINSSNAAEEQLREGSVIRLRNTAHDEKQGILSDDLRASRKDVAASKESETNRESTAGSPAGSLTGGGSGVENVVGQSAVDPSDGYLMRSDDLSKTDGENEKSSRDGEHDGGGGDDDEEEGKDECGQVTAACAEAEIRGDSLIVPIEVAGNRGDKIEAWGFDVDIKGLEYVEWVKSGCLTEESSSFMCNQLASGRIRCGSYTGELYIEGIQTLFKLHLKKAPNSASGQIRLMNFVDNLARSRPSECSVE